MTVSASKRSAASAPSVSFSRYALALLDLEDLAPAFFWEVLGAGAAGASPSSPSSAPRTETESVRLKLKRKQKIQVRFISFSLTAAQSQINCSTPPQFPLNFDDASAPGLLRSD